METMRNIGHAMFRSLTDEDKVFKYKDAEKKQVVVEHKVGHVAGGAFEKLGNMVQYGCSLAGTGTLLTGILGKAGAVVDATRIFEEANWFLKTEAKFRDNDGNFTLEYIKDFAIHSSFFMVGALSAGIALFEFNIVDLSWIGESLGSIAAYGGLGFIFAGGALPLLHAGIGIGVAICFVDGVINLWKDSEHLSGWQITVTIIKLAGNVAEVSLRVVAVVTGTSPVLIPVLGLISNGFGYIFIINETMEQTALENKCEVKSKKNGEVEFKFNDDMKKLVVGPRPKNVNPLWAPVLFFKPAVEMAAGVCASIKGMDKLAKVSVAITELAAPQFKALVNTLKSYRLVSSGIGFCATFSRHMQSEKSRKEFFDKAWADIKAFKLRRISEAFLFAAQLADLGKFVAKAAGCSGELGTFTLFDIPGRVSFSSLKATFIAGHMILTMIIETREIWKLYKEPNDKYNDNLQSFAFKFGLSAGKVGIILLSGGFILFAGYSSAVWFGVAQVGVFGLDLVDWAYKNVINKPATQVYKVA